MADFVLPASGVMTTKMVREHLQEMGVTSSLVTFTELINAAIYHRISEPLKPYRLSFLRNYRHDRVMASIEVVNTYNENLNIVFTASWLKNAALTVNLKVYDDSSGSYVLKNNITKTSSPTSSSVSEFININKLSTPYNLKLEVTHTPDWIHNGVLQTVLLIPAKTLNLQFVGRFGYGYQVFTGQNWQDSGICDINDGTLTNSYTESGFYEIGEKVYQDINGNYAFGGSENGTYYMDYDSGHVIKIGADDTIIANNLGCEFQTSEPGTTFQEPM
jgi:hypothetical protein